MVNLAQAVPDAAQRAPQKTALVAEGQTLSYAELDAAVSRLADGLRGAGLTPGDVVAMRLGTGIDFVISFYGTLRAGMVAAPANPRATAREVDHVLKLSGARMLITAADEDRTAVRTSTVVSTGTSTVACTVSELLTADPADQGPAEAAAQRSPEDVAAIIFTSGTTGAPKAAQLNHANLWASCTSLASRSSPEADDVVLACLPLHHVFGMSGLMNTAMAWGMTLVLLPKFDPATALELVAAHRVTRFSGVPTMFVDLLEEGDGGRDLSSLRYVTSGGSALREGFAERFEQMIPSATLLEGYGASETTSSVCVNSSRTDRRHGSVGTPSWGTQMRTVDDAGRVLACSPGLGELPASDEQVGELQVRGPTVFAGYAGAPEATADAFDGEWLRTGDLAWIDRDGYVYLVDRKSNMIIRGGLNVYPAEVEQVLLTVPGVGEAAVLGLPDERLGEEIAALVTLEPGLADTGDLLEEIQAHAAEELAGYKRPRVIELVESLPRSAAGKILRPDARKLLTERLAERAGSMTD